MPTYVFQAIDGSVLDLAFVVKREGSGRVRHRSVRGRVNLPSD